MGMQNNKKDEDTENQIIETLGINYSERDEDIFQRILSCQSMSTKYELNNNGLKVLIDASLILDVLLARPSIFLDDAINIMNLILSHSLNGYITEIGLKYIWEISRKSKDREDANYLIIKLLNSFKVCKIDHELIKRAREYHLNSFETGIQIECAKNNQLDAIITLRPKDFLTCGWEKIFHPSHFLCSYFGDKAIYSSVKSCQEKLNQSWQNDTEQEDKLLFEDKLLLFKGWKIEHFDVLCSKNNLVTASVVLLNTTKNNVERYSESAFGTGISTLFLALDKAISHIDIQSRHTFDSIKFYNLGEGMNSSVMVIVAIQIEKYKIRTIYTHKNFIKSCFYAYVLALKTIYSFDESDFDGKPLSTTNFLCLDKIINIYKIGERDFSQSDWREINLVNQQLSGINLTEANLSGANLTGANFTEANLSGANLTGVNFTEANLSGANLIGANFTEANLSGANLTGVNFTEANLSGANLSRCDLRGLDLNKTVFYNTIIINAKMPEIKISIYGNKRIERIIQLFNQFDSKHYVIYAVHNGNSAIWWNSSIAQEFRQINKVLSHKGISIKRVFILPDNDSFSEEINEIMEEQLNHQIEVRYLSEKSAQNLRGFNLIKTNLLVCRNMLVTENSFTTMMIVNKEQQEENGYISYKQDDIEINEQLFLMFWENAKSYSNRFTIY